MHHREPVSTTMEMSIMATMSDGLWVIARNRQFDVAASAMMDHKEPVIRDVDHGCVGR